MTRMKPDQSCRPDGHQACWPKTGYSAREPDPGPTVSNLLEPMSVSGSVTDAPGISRFDRGVAWDEQYSGHRAGAMARSSCPGLVEGRAHPRTAPGPSYHVPTRTAFRGTCGGCGLPLAS